MDIGEYSGVSAISDKIKYDLLNHPWKPNKEYLKNVFTDRGRQGRRYLNESVFSRFPWVAYSHTKNGLFCVPCVLFAIAGTGGRGQQQLGRLVLEPLQRYDKLTGADGYLTTHSGREYHKNSMQFAAVFKENYLANIPDVATQLRQYDEDQISKNQQALKSIIRAILVCGRSGCPLRGHRESKGGRDILKERNVNDGLFRELLRAFVDVGDENLHQHLSTAPRNATYTSPDIQNQIINFIGEFISKKLVTQVNKSQFFSIICDETSDNSHKEQLTVCLRYVVDNRLHEDFLQFSEICDVTGEGIAEQIIEQSVKAGVNMNGFIGMAFDGASAMSGKFRGAQAIIRQDYPRALYVHCYSHRLNLVISCSSEVTFIRNCWSTIQSIINFIAPYPQRTKCLESFILEEDFHAGPQRLQTFVATRWIERHDGVLRFKKFLSPILSTLNEISKWRNSGNALQLLHSVSSDFLVALAVLEAALKETKVVAEALQKESLDLVEARKEVQDLIEIFKKWQRDENAFKSLYKSAEEMAEIADITLRKPRIVGQQKGRPNASSSQAMTTEAYYRMNLFNPFIDNLIAEMTARFQDGGCIPAALMALMPRYFEKYDFNTLKPAVEHLIEDLNGAVEEVEAEYHAWKRFWKRKYSKLKYFIIEHKIMQLRLLRYHEVIIFIFIVINHDRSYSRQHS